MLFLLDAEALDDSEEDNDDEVVDLGAELVEISVQGLIGHSSPQTLRVNGCIKRQPVVILIDSGSTHNFVDPKTAKQISCRMQASEPFNVMVANGEKAFADLKTAMTSTPVLALPDFTHTFIVDCDASRTGIRAVLMQDNKLIAFTSKALSRKNLTISTYEKEMLVVVHAVTKWRPYLLGQHFKICTDHRSLRYLMEQRITTSMQQKWMSKLMGYAYEINYCMGSTKVVVDALSDPQSHSDYAIEDEKLVYKGRLVVASTSPLTAEIILEFHATLVVGHSGALKTYKRASRSFYWRGMKKDVEQFVAECDVCQCHKGETMATLGTLQPLPLHGEDMDRPFHGFHRRIATIAREDCHHGSSPSGDTRTCGDLWAAANLLDWKWWCQGPFQDDAALLERTHGNYVFAATQGLSVLLCFNARCLSNVMDLLYKLSYFLMLLITKVLTALQEIPHRHLRVHPGNLIPCLTRSSTLVLSLPMGLLKIAHRKLTDSIQSRHISYLPNVDGMEREENKVSEADSGDGSEDSELADLDCELGMVEDQFCNIPYELYDLPDLKEILSLNTWNSCLTEEERLALSAYLPDMDQQSFWLTMKELLGGNDIFFGSPMGELFKRLKGGFYPPKVSCFREGLQYLQRRKYYHSLRSYHEHMAQAFSDMRSLWDQCGPSIGVEERVYIWTERKNSKGMDPLDLNAYPRDEDLLSKDVYQNEIMCPLSKKMKSLEGKGVNAHNLPPLVVNGMKLVAPKTSGRGVLKIKSSGMNSSQTCIPKVVSSDTLAQCRPSPKGVLKIVPKGPSIHQEQPRAWPIWQESSPLVEAQGFQTSRFSPLQTVTYRQDAGHYGESPSSHQMVGGRKSYGSPKLPECIMDRRKVEFLNSSTGTSRSLEGSIGKMKWAKDLSWDAITDLQEHLVGGNPIKRNSAERGPKGGHELSMSSLNVKRYAFKSQKLWQNLGRENRELSRSSLEPYLFASEYYEPELHIAPMQEKHTPMCPRISEVVSRLPDIGIREQETMVASLDQMKGHKDFHIGGSQKLYDQQTVLDGLQDGLVLPITYKRRKAQGKLNSLDIFKPLTAGADIKSRTPKESTNQLGESAKAVKIKFKNWKNNSIN
ncbi:hypothetical protein HHK36_002345 [Tetracentron sinense]|uniref:DEUBAD domain-containing protein n=1 Tax=Tetracentron sinense TaxID=13715 RepID=A0A834ZUB8_TETSI|nr:hypothetical protein HHK36_002345 [Tetracentron sinense]